MSSLSFCSDLHSTINEQSLHDQSSSGMNIDHSNSSNSCSDLHSTINEQSLHDQSSSNMNIDHSNSSNSRYRFDFELYNTESFKLVCYDKLIHKKPFNGSVFDSLDIGLDFYKTYGQEHGFDVNMSSQKDTMMAQFVLDISHVVDLVSRSRSRMKILM
ncbi:unnamed protein product [Lactuca virosa]|uniref:Uncharacterized protein n=1 Tax=Lactuca virosa TaxID=75947 RepID=A0AAU9MGD3_9ASTR|nr:unnamed protein product [Lactuca virosa]